MIKTILKNTTIGALAVLAVVLGVSLVGATVSTYNDFVEGQKIPEVLKGDHRILGATRTIQAKTTTFTVDNAIDTYSLSAAGGAFVVTMPTASTCTGKEWIFYMSTAGGAVTFTPAAVGQLINGAQAAYAPGIDAVGDSTRIICDGSNFYSIGGKIH